MNLNDFFGSMPHRPDHPDMWKVADVLLKLDGALEAAGDDNQAKDLAFQGILEEVGIDSEVLSYAAMQRAFRVLGIRTRADLTKKIPEAIMLASVWTEAFAVGALVAQGEST